MKEHVEQYNRKDFVLVVVQKCILGLLGGCLDNILTHEGPG